MRVMESSVLLQGVRVYAFHGVFPQEKAVGNWFAIDVEVDVDFSMAMRTDSLRGTVSYADIYSTIVSQMVTPSQLLEHVAGRIAQALLREYPAISRVRLRLVKESPPIKGLRCEGCGVKLDVCR